jgi:glycosyltransferase involved in cell wall biosynthesis
MTAVIIPAYNAADTLKPLLERLWPFTFRDDVFVVDDGSSDATATVAVESGAQILEHSTNRGKGAALRTGFNHVLQLHKYNAVLTIDSDLQHDPADIPAFVQEWKSGEYQLLVGARRRIGTRMPVHRMFSNTVTSFLVSARTGQLMKDSQSGFRLISADVLSAVSTVSDGFEAETEFLIRAALKGFRIGFVPISTIYGTSGSHMTHWETTRNFISVLLKEY